ncbi:MAG TPA: PilZ domain-containing protein [Burkholderiales bacterium]
MASDLHDSSPPSVDRRLDPRLATRIEATVADPEHGDLAFTASGFSRTGAFLRRRDPDTPLPRVGSRIEIVFSWPLETDIPPVRVEATVIRRSEDGVGVRFEIRPEKDSAGRAP